jgi:hypothetical protein
MLDDNPYAVPEALLNSPTPAPPDPEIQVRERHRFPITGGWKREILVLIVSGVPFIALAVAISIYYPYTVFPLATAYTLPYMAWLYRFETNRATAWLLNAHFLVGKPVGIRLVAITFDKSQTNRPRRTGLWRFFPVDDIGLLSITEGRVRVFGDAVTLSLRTEDISSIEPARLFGLPGYTRVVLTRPITGHLTLILGNSQLWPLKQMFKGYRELREDLRRLVDPEEDIDELAP